MFTSCYSRLKQIPADLEPVAVSKGVPVWFQGRREPRLAPTSAMHSMSLPDMVATYRAYLTEIERAGHAQGLAESLGPRAVLLCWEPPGFACHRRIAAEWLEKLFKVEVAELGFPRPLLLSFDDLPIHKYTPVGDYPWKAKCDHCGKTNRVKLGEREWLCGKCGIFFTIEWEG